MSVLTDEQALQVAKVIVDTGGAIYETARSVTGMDIKLGAEADAVNKHVLLMGNLFKCEKCGTWRDHGGAELTTCYGCAEGEQ